MCEAVPRSVSMFRTVITSIVEIVLRIVCEIRTAPCARGLPSQLSGGVCREEFRLRSAWRSPYLSASSTEASATSSSWSSKPLASRYHQTNVPACFSWNACIGVLKTRSDDRRRRKSVGRNESADAQVSVTSCTRRHYACSRVNGWCWGGVPARGPLAPFPF